MNRKSFFTAIAVTAILAAIILTPLVYYYRPTPIQRYDWISCRGFVMDNATQPIFNVTIVVVTDNSNLFKGFTNESGQFEVLAPFPLNKSLPIFCYASKPGYVDITRYVAKLPNVTVLTEDHDVIWGYVDFQIIMRKTE